MWYSNRNYAGNYWIINNLNNSKTLISACSFVSLDIINIFPSIDNISGLKKVKSLLDARRDQFPPTACIIEVIKSCLECSNCIFNNKYFLKSDSTAQDPHMPCSYSNIAIQYFDVKVLEYTPATICWKWFRDDVFIAWPHSIDELAKWTLKTLTLILLKNSIYYESCYWHISLIKNPAKSL